MKNSLFSAWMIDVTTLTKLPAHTDGTEGKVTGDKDSGAILVSQNSLEASADSVTAVPKTGNAATIAFAATTTSTVRLGANSNRKGLIFAVAGGGAIMYVLFGTGTASATNFSVVVPIGQTVILAGSICPQEQVICVSASATGSASVTELA